MFSYIQKNYIVSKDINMCDDSWIDVCCIIIYSNSSFLLRFLRCVLLFVRCCLSRLVILTAGHVHVHRLNALLGVTACDDQLNVRTIVRLFLARLRSGVGTVVLLGLARISLFVFGFCVLSAGAIARAVKVWFCLFCYLPLIRVLQTYLPRLDEVMDEERFDDDSVRFSTKLTRS